MKKSDFSKQNEFMVKHFRKRRGKSPGAAKPQMKELPWGSSKIWALSGMSHFLNE